MARRKSGDSRLQDGHAAREHERLNPTRDGQDNAEHLVEELQDSAEQKREAGAPQPQVDAATQAILQLTQMVTQLTDRIMRLEKPAVQPAKTPYLKCGTCNQVLKRAFDGRGICDGTHVPVMVAPRDMSLWPAFQGVNWNGAKYGGMCLLPPAIVQAVISQISRWEDSERRRMYDHGKIFGEFDARKFSTGQTPVIS